MANRSLPTDVRRVGQSPRTVSDLYHGLVNLGWVQLFALISGGFLLLNLMFAFIYVVAGDSIVGARPGNLFDAFNFSVQTMATIGYGQMRPKTELAHSIVAVESLVSLLGIAVATGLLFAKFARPTAKVMFSDVATISDRDGHPTFSFRASNQRRLAIAHPKVSVVVARDDRTLEGEFVRRLIDLPLERNASAFFALTWTILHVIDEDSPLYGFSPAELERTNTMIIVSLIGHDQIYGQSVHEQQVYRPSDILFRRRLVDVLERQEDSSMVIDMRRFHDTVEWPLTAQQMGIDADS